MINIWRFNNPYECGYIEPISTIDYIPIPSEGLNQTLIECPHLDRIRIGNDPKGKLAEHIANLLNNFPYDGEYENV